MRPLFVLDGCLTIIICRNDPYLKSKPPIIQTVVAAMPWKKKEYTVAIDRMVPSRIFVIRLITIFLLDLTHVRTTRSL